MGSERQRLERAKFLAELEQEAAAIAAKEAASAEAKMAPIRAIESELSKNHAAYLKRKKATVLSEPDPDFTLTPEEHALAVATEEEAIRHNIEASEQFVAENPSYYPTPANYEALTDWATANKIVLLTPRLLKVGFETLSDLGLLEQWPAPEPEPQPEPIEQPAPIEEPQIDGEVGFDPETGERRLYTRFEVLRMTADQYRRAMRLPSAATKRWSVR